MSSSSSSNKRVRLSGKTCRSLLQVKGLSQSALAAVLEQVMPEGEAATRFDLRDSLMEMFLEVQREVDVEMKEGPVFKWVYADPTLYLSKLVRECEPFAKIFAKRLRENQCSKEQPWSLIVAWDESTPGNVLQPDNQRKSMACSFSFLELGHAALRTDKGWITNCIVRSTKIVASEGGWSSMLTRLLGDLLVDGLGGGLATSGVPLQLAADGGIVMFYARLTNLLSDGDGHKLAYDWKGASSLRPCLRHVNVLKLQSGLAHRSPDHVEISCPDHTLMRPATKASIEVMADILVGAKSRVDAGTMSPSEFLEIEQATGLNFNAKGMLWNILLRERADVLGALTVDWMHCSLQDGAYSVEINMFLEACWSNKVESADLQEFLNLDWQFPNALSVKGKTVRRMVDYYLKTGAEKMKGQASQFLSLHALLRHWVETRVADKAVLRKQRAAYLAAADVLDEIMAAKRGRTSMVEASGRLRRALKRHMLAHLKAYGDRGVKPKTHWLWDVADHMLRDPFVLDAFVVERLHLEVKDAARMTDNLETFEASVLMRVMNSHVGAIDRGFLGDHLVGNSVPFPGCPSAVVSNSAELEGVTHRVGDVVLRGSSAGRIAACAREGDVFWLAVDELVSQGSKSAHSQLWRSSKRLAIWSPLHCVTASAWLWFADGSGTVLP
jgi:hypothetical protein